MRLKTAFEVIDQTIPVRIIITFWKTIFSTRLFLQAEVNITSFGQFSQALIEPCPACMSGEVDVQFGDIQRKEKKKEKTKKIC